jgi:hypothetical protein
MSRRTRALKGASAALVGTGLILVIAAIALAATPKTGKWVDKDTNPGQNEVSGKPTFEIADGGRLMKKFTIPDVSKYCAYIGVSAGPVYIPKAKIDGGRVNLKYNYGPKNYRAQYHLTGRFGSASSFKGEVKGTKTCTFDVKLKAHPE